MLIRCVPSIRTGRDGMEGTNWQPEESVRHEWALPIESFRDQLLPIGGTQGSIVRRFVVNPAGQARQAPLKPHTERR